MFVVNQTSRSGVGMSQGDNLFNSLMQDQPARREEYVEGNLKLCDVFEGEKEVMCVRYSPDGSLLAVGQSDGLIKIFSTDKSQCLYNLMDANDKSSKKLPVTSIKFLPADNSGKVEHGHILMATYASGLIKFWHYTSSSVVASINEARQTLCSAINPKCTSLATGGADAQLHLYDMASKRKIRTMEASDSRDVMNGHRARIFSMQYHPFEPNLFISGGWDDTIQFWDDRQKHALRKLYGPHICGDAIDIDATHNHILTGSWRKDSTLQIWDFPSGEKIKDVPQDNLHGSLLYCAQWVGKENIVCGGCEQNMVRVIDRGTLNTVGQLVELPRGVYTLDNDRQGVKPKIAVGAAHKVYILKTEKKQ